MKIHAPDIPSRRCIRHRAHRNEWRVTRKSSSDATSDARAYSRFVSMLLATARRARLRTLPWKADSGLARAHREASPCGPCTMDSHSLSQPKRLSRHPRNARTRLALEEHVHTADHLDESLHVISPRWGPTRCETSTIYRENAPRGDSRSSAAAR